MRSVLVDTKLKGPLGNNIVYLIKYFSEELQENNACVCQNPCNVSSFNIVLSSLRIRHETVDKLRELHRHNLPDVDNLE